MMPEPWRKTGRKAADGHFPGLGSEAVMEAAAYHENGDRMGHYVCQLKRRDPLGSDAAPTMTWTGVMAAIEDDYFKWWYESTIGKIQDKKEAFFHFCEIPQGDCPHQGGYLNLIHVDVFRFLQPDEVEKARWMSAAQKAEAA